MGRIKMSEEQFLKNRQNILDTALQILVEKGLKDVSARKVAAALNMTATNIYNYYKNKDELIFAMQNYGFKMLWDQLESSYSESLEPIDNIRGFINAYLSFAMNQPRIYSLMFGAGFEKYYKHCIGSKHFNYIFFNEEDMSLKIPNVVSSTIDKAKKNNPRISNDNSSKLALKLFSASHGFITLYNNNFLNYIVPNEVEFLKENVEYLVKPFETYDTP